MSEPLSDAELDGLRRHMAETAPAPGSGRGHGWPWGSSGNDELVRRLLATVDVRRLTEQELAALDKLSDAINAILALPSCHDGAERELVPLFHAIQEKVMARAAVRAHRYVFRAEEGFR